MKYFFLAICFFACAICASAASTPTFYFTDLQSGPVGSIVTAYGANLQGTVTVNGVSATVISSSPTKVSFTVPNTTSGSITIGASNALPFTIRSGHIFYVTTNGSDSNSGSAEFTLGNHSTRIRYCSLRRRDLCHEWGQSDRSRQL